MAGRFTNPNYQFFDDNGDPLAGGKLEFFASGTSTPQDTFSDDNLTVANTNPVILNGAGRAGDIFLSSDDYKVVLKKSDDTVVWTADPVRSPSEKNTAVQDVSAATQLDVNDNGALIACNANAGGFVVTLPPAADAGNGYEISIIKVDSSSNIVTVDASGSETINGALDYQLLTQYATVTLRCDGSRWYVTAESVSRANAPFDPGHLDGMQISVNPTTDVTVEAGSVRSDDDAKNITLSSAITKKINATFAEGNNQGGLDTGSVAADSRYYVWSIAKADGQSDVLLSLAASSPTLPSGFEFKRIRGYVETDGSSNLRDMYLEILPGGDDTLSYNINSDQADVKISWFNDDNWNHIDIDVTDLAPVTNQVVFRARTSTDGGATFDSGASDYLWRFSGASGSGSATSDHIAMTPSGSNGLSNTVSKAGFSIRILMPGEASQTNIKFSGVFLDATAALSDPCGGGQRLSAAAVNAIQLYLSSGDIASGAKLKARFYK